MIQDVVHLTLPEPPSANRWWRHVGSRVLVSREARTYKQIVANRLVVARVRPIAAPSEVSVRIAWYRGRKSGDLDKRLGVLLDAMQGTAYESDAQITELTATRHDDKANPRVEVTVALIAR